MSQAQAPGSGLVPAAPPAVAAQPAAPAPAAPAPAPAAPPEAPPAAAAPAAPRQVESIPFPLVKKFVEEFTVPTIEQIQTKSAERTAEGTGEGAGEGNEAEAIASIIRSSVKEFVDKNSSAAGVTEEQKVILNALANQINTIAKNDEIKDKKDAIRNYIADTLSNLTDSASELADIAAA
ncbi:hypothetical protein DID76_03685 [Candidatus Marinamargulisbacteria bacterium SCGC AG-414-C22]|nr:hypothetical protein DID76_03685 [Candidatus Marinamargulisbacteria bacterium SCGC AG-414-C22]